MMDDRDAPWPQKAAAVQVAVLPDAPKALVLSGRGHVDTKHLIA